MIKAMKPTMAIVSLGCDKNRVNTEKMLGKISDLVKFSSSEDAEYVFVNTCGFLESARQELYQILESFKSDQKLILAGCFWKFANKEFFERFPGVIKFIMPDDDLREIFSHLEGEGHAIPLQDGKRPIFLTPPSYAFLKVAEGCDNHCTFCIIPQLKGAYRSRSIEDILKDARNYLNRGVKELILVAQDVGNFGADLGLSLRDLLKELENLQEKGSCMHEPFSCMHSFKIRLLYLYPERITDDLLDYIAQSKKVLPYFDMPLQHASDRILKSMGRPYTKQEIITLIGKIRNKVPDAVIRSTLIVGFPGETSEDFSELKSFLIEQKLNHIGVFGYSDEELCAAYNLGNKIEQKTSTSE